MVTRFASVTVLKLGLFAGATLASLLAIFAACSTSPSASDAADGGADADADFAPEGSTAPFVPIERDVLVASDFDQICSANDECVAVAEGPCGPCFCPNAAINKGAIALYKRAQERLGCSARPGPECACAPVIGICVAGRCAVGSPQPELDASAYASPCTTAKDCTVSSASPCFCEPLIGVSKASGYEAVRAAAKCGTPAANCKAPINYSVVCDAGTCSGSYFEVP